MLVEHECEKGLASRMGRNADKKAFHKKKEKKLAFLRRILLQFFRIIVNMFIKRVRANIQEMIP
jgi:hypothetical protein